MYEYEKLKEGKFVTMEKKYTRVKYACYTANACMSAVIILPPMLFTTFRELYDISYSLLGLLVVVNFCTQLILDLIFSFFSHKFNMEKTVKTIPVFAIIGFALYAILPMFFPDAAYLCLLLGTVIFSASSGLAEVLVSPVIAAIPSDNPDKEMSQLHSVYAWGVVFVVIVSTVFLLVFGRENWHYLVLMFIAVPTLSLYLFTHSDIPHMATPEHASGVFKLLFTKEMLFCFLCIFLGGASENVMSQWGSGYLENSLQLPKVWGDIIGIALFATALGVGRSLYALKGKNISKTIFYGAIGATTCYLLAVFVNIPIIAALACAATGFCVAMMWPGSLLIASEKIPHGGVAVFALMAAGGDLGSSVAPQLVGVVTDFALENDIVNNLALQLNYTPEQIAMKLGLLIATLFPIAAIAVYSRLLVKKK